MALTFAKLSHPPATPLQRIRDPEWEARGVTLWLKRDELLAPAPDDPFCGNKWRKLQYNLWYARERKLDTLVSFGGPFSNHIAALASAGQHLGFHTIGLIRGEVVENPTLRRARADGMTLHFVDRNTYRRQAQHDFDRELWARFGPHLLLPEGGTNALALKGCADLGREILDQLPVAPTCVAVACGTGGTLAGLVTALSAHCPVLGVSALRGSFLQEEVEQLLLRYTKQRWPNWSVAHDDHHGGYAKLSPELVAFMRAFTERHGILLDPIYTGKLLFALYRRLREGAFRPDEQVVAIHTGGLQGRAGFEGRL
ncbi:MAG: 1-aminocyclopropane-1-carboxylate deaminase/D-cysteine desulfhydrase [Lewinella sp.]|nr:1-aminocyclopropane-1-carboxylate deaminase/D-cysteine desulfhydrase [Lewinella sp.]